MKMKYGLPLLALACAGCLHGRVPAPAAAPSANRTLVQFSRAEGLAGWHVENALPLPPGPRRRRQRRLRRHHLPRKRRRFRLHPMRLSRARRLRLPHRPPRPQGRRPALPAAPRRRAPRPPLLRRRLPDQRRLAGNRPALRGFCRHPPRRPPRPPQLPRPDPRPRPAPRRRRPRRILPPRNRPHLARKVTVPPRPAAGSVCRFYVERKNFAGPKRRRNRAASAGTGSR